MRLLEGIAPIVVAFGVIYGLWRLGVLEKSPAVRPSALEGRARTKAIARARWEAAEHLEDDRAVVTVRRAIPRPDGGTEVLSEMKVASVLSDAPEWAVLVSQALMDARVRAEVLNQEGSSR